MPKPLRVLSVSDLHAGNVAGLTPPDVNPYTEKGMKLWSYRNTLYNWVTSEIEKLKPIDICVANGDLIDGRGKKGTGTEQITTDLNEQVKWAASFLKWIDAKEYHVVAGTSYHTGEEADMEVHVASALGCSFDDICTIDVNGLIMRWRHHLGSSQVPHGRATSLLRQKLWDVLWGIDDEYQKADVMIFAHVHYLAYAGDRFGLAISSPALQGLGGSNLGARRLGGLVDYGFLHFDVGGKDDYTWQAHRLIQTHAVRAAGAPSPVQPLTGKPSPRKSKPAPRGKKASSRRRSSRSSQA